MTKSKPALGGFAARKRKAVRVSEESLVRSSFLDDERRFPLVLEPNLDNVNLLGYAESHRQELETKLGEHGAILFRGFRTEGVPDFEAFIAAVSSGALTYTERSSPRSQVHGNIYTSTDYPPEQEIFLHNEQSYNQVFPRKILFYCVTPAETGGETPIADCRRVFEQIDPEVRERFSRSGYLYRRNFGDGFGLTWETVFQTDDRQAVERYCDEHRIRWEWKEGNRLRTEQVRRCTAKHPDTGVPIWFNHLTFFHVSTLPPSIRDSMLAEFSEEDLPNNTLYGDGTPIEPEVLEELRAIYHRETFAFPWQKGDILMLDNMSVAHGRRPFTGARKVVAGMADPLDWDDVEPA
jgi:alpha-ketoglutarate-dependent taurine dioxygenase